MQLKQRKETMRKRLQLLFVCSVFRVCVLLRFRGLYLCCGRTISRHLVSCPPAASIVRNLHVFRVIRSDRDTAEACTHFGVRCRLLEKSAVEILVSVWCSRHHKKNSDNNLQNLTVMSLHRNHHPVLPDDAPTLL